MCCDDDLTFGSYGLDQCLDLAKTALASNPNNAVSLAGAVFARSRHWSRP